MKLSICISSYNRAAYIGETLDSILPQLTEEVELLVLDGGSTDSTAEVMKNYQSCPNLRYIRMGPGEGFDEKYIRLVNEAKGTYCWLFSDDDILKPGAVAAVLRATDKSPVLVVVNAEVRTKDFSQPVQSSRVKLLEDKIYSSDQSGHDALLAETGDYLTFIGAIVIRRDIWLNRETRKYIGTAFVHSAAVFQKPLPGHSILLAYPWITIRYGNAQWVSKSFEIWYIHWPELIWSTEGYSDWARQKVVIKEPWRSYTRLLLDRAMARFSPDDYERLLKGRISSPARRLATCIIAMAPVPLLNPLARFFVKYILRKNPSIALFDLEAWWRNYRSKRTSSKT